MTRESMIEALLERWMAREAEKYQAILGNDSTAGARLKAHLQSTQRGQSYGAPNPAQYDDFDDEIPFN